MFNPVKSKSNNEYIQFDQPMDPISSKPKIQSLANSVITRLANLFKNRPATNQYARLEE